MPLFAIEDSTIAAAGFGIIAPAVTAFIIMFRRDRRTDDAKVAVQWRNYGLQMAKKYEDAVVRHEARIIEYENKRLADAATIARLTEELSHLRSKP